MKDSILNTTLIAATFAAILFSTFGDFGSNPSTATAQASRVVTMETTVVAARRLPADVAAVAPDVTLVASAAP